MKRLSLLIVTLASLLQLSGCGFSQGSSASPPIDLQIAAGDSSIIATWTMASGVEYWLSTTSLATNTEILVSQNVTSPQTIGPFVNGQGYSFVMDARVNKGPAGSKTAPITATPRNAGATWTTGASLGAMELRGAAYNPGLVAGGFQGVTVGSSGALFSSTNGKTWTAISNPDPATPKADLNALRFGGFYIAAGAAGTVITSPDLVTWTKQVTGTTSDLYGLATNGGGQYVAVGANGTLINTSNGVNFASAASGTTNRLNAVTYGVVNGIGRYVAVGANGTLITSTDGVTWTAANSNTSANLNGVAFGAWVVTATGVTVTAFVAVGDAGTILTSPDGLTWTAKAAITANNLTAVDFGRQFVAVGAKGTILTSTEAVAWTPQTSGTTNDLKAVARSPYSYSAVGAAGTNLYSF